MTKQLTKHDADYIKRMQDNSPIVRFIRSQNNFNFTVGDYLIKRNKRNDKWETETISNISDQPKRFICIHEDEYGIKYIRPLTSLGRELPYITMLTDVNDWTRYEVDPDYAEHLILSEDEEFDFSEKRKKDKSNREAITRKNRKISTRASTAEEIDIVFGDMKAGDFFWMGYTIPEAASGPKCELVSVQEIDMHIGHKLKSFEYRYIERRQGYPDQKRSVTSEDLRQRVIFKTEPFPYETI